MNIMLVDDYPLIISGLKKEFDWLDAGFPIVAEAYNGKQALAYLKDSAQKIDIIFTDIQMPVMDGLDLIKEVKKTYPHIKIAVLSAYDDYVKVRHAFNLGANDYLLKNETNSKALQSVLERFKSEILVERSQEQAQEIGLSENWEPKEDLITEGDTEETKRKNRNNQLRMMLENKDIRLEQFELADISWAEKGIALMLFTIETADARDNAEYFFFSAEKELSLELEERFEGYCFPTNYNEFAFFYAKTAGSKTAHAIYAFLAQHFFDKGNIIITAGNSDYFTTEKHGHILFSQAKDALAYRFILGKGRLICYSEVPIAILEEQKENEVMLKNIKRALDRQKIAELQKKIEQALSEKQETMFTELGKAKAFYVRCAWLFVEYIERMRLPIDCDKLLVTVQLILSMGDVNELNRWLLETLAQMEKSNDNQSKYVALFKQYISENYSDSNLRSDDVAEYLGITVGYMGKLVYKEIGSHFSDYLNRYRIDKAMELLTEPGVKVYEVADMTGYNNVEHFSRVFKKITGMSPSNYSR